MECICIEISKETICLPGTSDPLPIRVDLTKLIAAYTEVEDFIRKAKTNVDVRAIVSPPLST